jgi:hypothetical protein
MVAAWNAFSAQMDEMLAAVDEKGTHHGDTN